MQLVSLKKGETLLTFGQIPFYVYYPIGAIVSMICASDLEHEIETYMLGRTCMVGVAAINSPSFYRARVRSAGLAYRLAVNSLLKYRADCTQYMAHAQEAWLTMTKHLSQGIVCGKLHKIEQQLIRWILVTLDRSLTSNIDMTHKEISSLLGFRRENVTLAMNRFSELGLIKQSRGNFVVADRTGLEKLSCECYWTSIGKKRP